MHFDIEHSGICYQKYPRKNLKITRQCRCAGFSGACHRYFLSFWLIFMNKKINICFYQLRKKLTFFTML